MSRVLFITQQFDPAHPLLATTIPQVGALARQVDEVVIVAELVDERALPANARAYSFASRWRLGRGLKVIAAVARELPGLRRERGAVIVHMCSLYALLSAPLVRGARLPLVMWWSHWKINLTTRAAERVCTAICTVEPRTFPMNSRKIVSIGQGIDVGDIPVPDFVPPVPGAAFLVVVGSRYSPAKGIGTILRAAKRAAEGGLDLRVLVHGPAVTEEEQREKVELGRLVDELALTELVTLGGPLTRSELLALLPRADVLVNNARGGADRIAYEAAACCVPVLASNPVYVNLLDSDALFAPTDVEGLAERLSALAAQAPAERHALGLELRSRVEQRHSVDSWARGVLGAARQAPAQTLAPSA